MRKTAIGLILFGAIVSPIIPQQETYLGAYQYHPADLQSITSATSTITLPPTFPDDDHNGVVSVAVFTDASGNRAYQAIPDSQYASMGAQGGYKVNPTATDFTSLLSAITTQAHAAVVLDHANDTFSAPTAVSSITYTLTNTAGNIIVVCAGTEGGSTVSSATYDGVTITNDIGSATNVGSRIENCKSLANPHTGTTLNVVVNFSISTENETGAITFTGAAATPTGVQTEIGTLTNMSLTVTTCDANGQVLDAMVTGLRTWTFGGSQNTWYNTQSQDLSGGGSFKTGAASVTMTETISSAAEGAHIAFCVPVGVAAAVNNYDDSGWWMAVQ